MDQPTTPEHPDGQQGQPPQGYPPPAYPPPPAPSYPPPAYPAAGQQQPAQYPPADPNQGAGYQYPQHGQPAGTDPGQHYAPAADPSQAGYQYPTNAQAGAANPNQGGGYPYPAGGYPPAAAGQPGWGQPPTGGSRKKRYVIGGAIVVVAALIVGGILIFSGGDGNSSASPGDVVTGYLNDLAKGDAAGALALGPKPASAVLLTDGILSKQQAAAKIGNIKVVETKSGKYEGQDAATVHVTYSFGAKSADALYDLTKASGKWKMQDTVIPLDVSAVTEIPGLTIDGVDVSKLSKVYVFPGPLQYGSTNANITVTNSSKDFSTDTTDNIADPELDAQLSGAGKAAVQAAVKTALAGCAKSKKLSVEECDLHEYGFNLPDSDAVDNTATWSVPTDLSALHFNLTGEDGLKVSVDGQLKWKVTFQAKNFLNRKVKSASDTVTGSMFGSVDLSKTPPAYSSD